MNANEPTSHVHFQQPRKRSRWWIPVVVIFGALFVLFLAFSAFIGFVISMADFSQFSKRSSVEIKPGSVLVININGGLAERLSESPFSFLDNKRPLSFTETLEAIRAAATDHRIAGVLIKADGESAGFANLYDLRKELVSFREGGKSVYAFIETGTKAHYFLASAAQTIAMPTEGLLMFNAFGASSMFFRGLSDKIGVEWIVEQFEEYKSAGESFSRTKWSDPARQSIRDIIVQREKLFVDATATARSISNEKVQKLLSEGIYTAVQLRDNGIVDTLLYEADFHDLIRKQINPDDTSKHGSLKTVSLRDYFGSLSDSDSYASGTGKSIAVIYAVGAISHGSPAQYSDDGIYTKRFIRELRRARDNKNVGGIIIRVESPGGSVIASDDIRAEIVDIRKQKPVYASMANVAASGGYYISMACDSIFCHPATITGSIGVISMVPNIAGTMTKIGVTIDTISLGSSAHELNTMLPATDNQRRKLRQLMEPVYRRFVQKVAQYRSKSYDEARELARGRIYTGAAAYEKGLVDVLGNMGDAIAAMTKRLDIDSGQKARIIYYPKTLEFIERILADMGLGDDGDDEASAFVALKKIFGHSNALAVIDAMPAGMRQSLHYVVKLSAIARNEPVMMAVPDLPVIE